MESDISDFTGHCDSSSFLESFNIGTGTEHSPHFIVNLDAFSTTTAESPCASSESVLLSQGLSPSDNIVVPSVPDFSQFVSIGSTKGRSRGSYKPLNEMVETKIRTYEGADSHTKISALMQHFPLYKRSFIDRIFTKNLLDFDSAYKDLYMMHSQQQEELSKIRLILTPKCEKSKTRRIIPNIKSPELINLPPYRGRPSRRAGNRYYRRVIVGKDGSVEAADVTERKFLLSANMLGSLAQTSHHQPQLAHISSPGLQKNDIQPEFENLAENSTSAIESDMDNPCHLQNDFVPSPNVVPTTTSGHQPGQSGAGNKFFRSNRMSDAELKKRDYVTKELHGQGNVARSSISKTFKNESVSLESTENSAANFMAGVGVFTAPVVKRRGRKPKAIPIEKDNIIEVSQEDNLDLMPEERVLLLSYFNTAPSEELCLMPGCSQRTAEVIINMRPFKTTTELKLRLEATRYLSSNLIDACKELMQARSMFSALLDNCATISNRVMSRMQNLFVDPINLPPIKTEDVKNETEEFLRKDKLDLLREQPVILHPLRQLKPYQLVGLNWLHILHDENVNGILADEMGLGKTIQAIAFLAYLWENGERGPHLIVCPSSTVENWKRELHNWCSQLKVLVYQGPADQRKAMRLKIYENCNNPDFNVLLTSYSVGSSTLEDRALMKRVDFQYGIFDEAHMLKNMTTQRYKIFTSFKIKRRLLLTGTPLQNSLIELISLLAFVMPDLFLTNTDHLKRIFQIMGKSPTEDSDSNESKNSNDSVNLSDNEQSSDKISIFLPNRSNFERERLDQARKLLQPFCLRRLKTQVLMQLPPKTEETIYVPLSKSQLKCYEALIARLRDTQAVCLSDGDFSAIGEDDGTTNKLLNNVIPSKRSINGNTQASAKKRAKLSNLPQIDEDNENNSGNKFTPYNMLMQLRKASNHELLLPRISYSDDNLRELSMLLRNEPGHSDADQARILEDLSSLSDHQVHRVCRLYGILNPFALSSEALVQGSGKIAWLEENIPKLLQEGHRILIFSQLVIMLDILGEYLMNKGHKFLRLDGSTPVIDRQTLIDNFNGDETYEIFLLSTRAGGLGISLTGADVVILHDLDFNPYNDRQAADRCHRLGQSKPVHVIRLVSIGTVEENIWRNSEEKLRLEGDVTDIDLEQSLLNSSFESAFSRPFRSDSCSLVSGNFGNTSNELKSPEDLIAASDFTNIKQGEIIKYLSDALRPCNSSSEIINSSV